MEFLDFQSGVFDPFDPDNGKFLMSLVGVLDDPFAGA